jgi:hypothetical protein
MVQLFAGLTISSDDAFAFSVELVIFVGFIVITVFLFLLHNKFPQLTKNGWIELIIGTPCLAFKGLFDALDTITQDYDILSDVFDSLDAASMFLGLVFLAIGLLRIAFYSAKIWEVR